MQSANQGPVEVVYVGRNMAFKDLIFQQFDLIVATFVALAIFSIPFDLIALFIWRANQ